MAAAQVAEKIEPALMELIGPIVEAVSLDKAPQEPPRTPPAPPRAHNRLLPSGVRGWAQVWAMLPAYVKEEMVRRATEDAPEARNQSIASDRATRLAAATRLLSGQHCERSSSVMSCGDRARVPQECRSQYSEYPVCCAGAFKWRRATRLCTDGTQRSTR